GQDEFYFPLPYAQMDVCLYGKNRGVSAEIVARACDLTADHVRRVWADIDTKRTTTRYLQLAPLLIEPVAEITK
ncbi:MAG: NAD(+) synthase, partial [Opitutaceae bacterium]|nr:NAD(+) synthase [Verrucomicrobiales bacterium]